MDSSSSGRQDFTLNRTPVSRPVDSSVSEEVLSEHCVLSSVSSKKLDSGGVSSSLPNNNQSSADRKQEAPETIRRGEDPELSCILQARNKDAVAHEVFLTAAGRASSAAACRNSELQTLTVSLLQTKKK